MGRRLCLLAAVFGAALLLLAPPVSASGALPKRELDYSIDGFYVKGCGDSLLVSVSWTFRNWEIADRKALVFEMSLKGGGRTIKLRPVSVYGRAAARSATFMKASGKRDEVAVKDLSRPVSLTVSEYFPYDSNLDTLKVFLTVSEWNRNIGLMQLSFGQKGSFVKPAEPEFPGFRAEVFEPASDPGELRHYRASVPLVFEGSSYAFDSRVNPDVPDFVRKLRTLVGFREISFRNTFLTVYCGYSGDGEDYEKISRNRSQNLYSYLSRQCAMSRMRVTRSGGGFDWDGTVRWIGSSRYLSDSRLMEIAGWDASDRDRLVAMRKEKPRAWEDMTRRCFPALGRAVFETDFTPFPFRTADAVRTVYDAMPELLVPHDFWYLSTLYDHSSAEWLDVVLAGADLHPGSWELNCNAVEGLLERDAVREASVYLRNIEGVPEGRYVTAAWCYAAGKYDECVDILGELRDQGGRYASEYAKLVPYIDWSTNFVEWKKVNY